MRLQPVSHPPAGVVKTRCQGRAVKMPSQLSGPPANVMNRHHKQVPSCTQPSLSPSLRPSAGPGSSPELNSTAKPEA